MLHRYSLGVLMEKFLLFPDVKITAIDDSVPSITTDGGTWTNGEVVTGPVKSITEAGPYMTLSATDGRWLVTEPGYQSDLKLNSKVKSDDQVLADATLYTLMDAEGNVTDLTDTDPGYKQMVTTSTIS